MRAVIQRVKHAKVKADGKVVGEIGAGYFVLLGVKKGDSEEDATGLAEKIGKIRLMPDDMGKMNLSLNDANASVLVVSQFTLYGNTKKGNRPSFVEAMEPHQAQKLYNRFISKLKTSGLKVKTGNFGKYMSIDTRLDGPVTLIIET